MTDFWNCFNDFTSEIIAPNSDEIESERWSNKLVYVVSVFGKSESICNGEFSFTKIPVQLFLSQPPAPSPSYKLQRNKNYLDSRSGGVSSYN